MIFDFAKPVKYRVIYTDDRIPESKRTEHKMFFFKSSTLRDYFNNHQHFTIQRITIAYDYPRI